MHNIFIILLTLLSLVSAKRINLEKEMESLAAKVTRNVKPSGEELKTLVIIPLNDSRAPGFATMVEQYLTTPLIQQGKVSVVDRSQLSTIMQEAELQIMNESPMQMGKIAAANYMLTGTVSTGFDNNYLITLRLISVETTHVVGAASLEIPCSELNKRVPRN